jgi:hypothetical protein
MPGWLDLAAPAGLLSQVAMKNPMQSKMLDPRGGTEGAVGYGGGANAPVRLVVARRMPDGSVRYGRPGDNHSSLVTEQELAAARFTPRERAIEKEMGFALPGGQWLNRYEASKLMEVHPTLGKPDKWGEARAWDLAD